MIVTLDYFAQLRELAGRTHEQRTIEPMSLSALYTCVKKEYDFPLEQEHLRVALNDAFASWDDVPKEGDVVVFIPPVAGG